MGLRLLLNDYLKGPKLFFVPSIYDRIVLTSYFAHGLCLIRFPFDLAIFA